MTGQETAHELPATVGTIARVLHELLAVPQLLEEVREGLARQGGDLRDLQEASEGGSQELAKVRSMLGDLLDRQVLLEDASKRERELRKEHIQRFVEEPLLKRVIALCDLSDPSQCAEGDNSAARQLLEAVHRQAIEDLASHGCERTKSDPLDTFNPAEMRPVRRQETGWMERDQRIAKSLQAGYRRGTRILRYESVVLYEGKIKEEESAA